MRPIVLHYHYFKNAGTSVDAVLQKNFPGQWATAEFAGVKNDQAVAEWIKSHPDTVAFSSHTAQFPLPVVEGVEIFPVVFLRHPLDRIRSAYSFERKQASDSLGARLAKQTDLAGYIRSRLDTPYDYQCRNFQTFRLAKLTAGPKVAELDRAVAALHQLPFVGVVEYFDVSMARLEALLRPHIPHFRAAHAHRNATGEGDLPLDGRIDALCKDLGASLFEELLEANMKDICVHHAATVRLTAPSNRPPIEP